MGALTVQARPDLAAVFERDGHALAVGVLDVPACGAVAHALAELPPASAGTRCLLQHQWCRDLAATLRQHAALQALLPAGHVATQCTFFEKSAHRNWLVATHQDLSIAVAEPVDAPGLNGWSQKEGVWYVQAPATVLEQLVAVRLHLDDCGEFDGPLNVLPDTHRLGRLDDEAIAALRATHPAVACTAAAGDVLVMRPLLLHASSKATGRSRRRVLHFVYGPQQLPLGLRWREAA